MRMKRKVAIALAMGLVLGGLATVAAAAVFPDRSAGQTMMVGSSGNIQSAGKPDTVGSILPGQCALIGVGDFIGSTSCSTLLSKPYELTETPISMAGTNPDNDAWIDYFTVTTTNPATAGHQIVFSVRLCEQSAYSATSCNTPPGGITIARCSPLPGSRTCSWHEASEDQLRFQQWQPNGSTPCPPGGVGICNGKDPGHTTDYGLIDIVAARGCSSTCPNGTYDPGHISWSVAYLN